MKMGMLDMPKYVMNKKMWVCSEMIELIITY